MEKTCSMCGELKPLSEYHRRRHYKKDGHRAACKTCTAQETKKAREARGGTISDEERKKAQVRHATRRLIMSGELVPQPCEVCQSLDVQAHHPSYEGEDAARRVKWLCPLHHAQEHGVRAWTKQMDMFPERPAERTEDDGRQAVTYRAQALED